MIRRPFLRWPPWGKVREAKEQLADDKQTLSRVRAQWPAVQAVAATLHAHRERNHFSEAIAHIYREGNR